MGRAVGGAGPDEPDAIPREPGTGSVTGPKKHPHPYPSGSTGTKAARTDKRSRSTTLRSEQPKNFK